MRYPEGSVNLEDRKKPLNVEFLSAGKKKNKFNQFNPEKKQKQQVIVLICHVAKKTEKLLGDIKVARSAAFTSRDSR